MTRLSNDFDHVIPHNYQQLTLPKEFLPTPLPAPLPGWVREPPADYQTDDDPGYEAIEGTNEIPMVIIIGKQIHGWNDQIGNFEKLPYEFDDDGKVVARYDGS